MEDIKRWLESHGLEKYAQVFEDNELDMDVLDELTMDELKDLQIPLGARKRILKAIAAGTQACTSDESANTEPATAPTREAQRRQLTVMFCDLVGSTALSEALDPEDYRDIIAAYQTAASAVIQAHDGYLARFMGDGLLIYFGYPEARENDPERATRAGLAIVEAVAALDVGADLEVRVGIATGPVVVGDIIGEGASEEAAVLGETPNLAARLQGAAAPNFVLLSPATERLLGGRVETQPLAPVTLKGFSGSIVPHRALRPRSLSDVSGTQFDASPLIGRDVELALLERAWVHAQACEGQVVLLSGEPGVGKSRLLRAFQDSLDPQRRRRVQWHCSPYHQTTANYPAIEQLKRSIGLDDDDPDGSLERLEGMVGDLGLPVEEVAPLLTRLLSMPASNRHVMPEYAPEETKRRVMTAQIELLLAAAAQFPVLFMMEDLHWADPSTVETVGEMTAAIQDSRVLILMTARPEFQPPWGTPANGTVHRLNSLTKSETRTLIRGILKQHGLAAELVESIVARADGVPLFIEEVTKNLLEASGDAGVPASLQDSLMARLDRLGATKELAQMASVIGRSFDLDALNALTEWPRATVEKGLGRLFEAGLVRRRTSGEYEFKHALVRDAAYDSMLRGPLRRLHGRYADHLKTTGAGDRQPELLAQHYTEAGNAEQAMDYWIQAGDRALAHAAQPEAAAHFQRALALLDALDGSARRPVDELSVLLRLGQAQFGALGGAAPQTMETYGRAATLAEQLESQADLGRAHYGRCVGLIISGRIQEAYASAAEIERLSVESGDRWAQAVSNRLYGATHYLTGRLHEAREVLQQVLLSRDALEQGPRGFGHDPYFTASPTLALIEWALGFPETAIDRAERNLSALDPVTMNPNTLSYALVWRLFLALFTRQQDQTSATVGTLEEHARRSGGKFWAALCMWGKGAHLIRNGQAQDGLAILGRGHRDYIATGALQVVPLARLLEAEGHIQVGDTRACLTTLNEAQELTARTSQVVYDPEIHRLRGTALVLTGDKEGAAISFSEALKLSRVHGNKSFELRAATSLAALWTDLGQREAARNLLAPVFDWFTEGEDLPDLVDARGLLAKLEQT